MGLEFIVGHYVRDIDFEIIDISYKMIYNLEISEDIDLGTRKLGFTPDSI